MSTADLFDIGEEDSVSDAWLTTINLLDMLEQTNRLDELYEFDKAREKIAKVYAIAEGHNIDKGNCACGLSKAEHAILKRKIMSFFKLQVANLKRFIY